MCDEKHRHPITRTRNVPSSGDKGHHRSPWAVTWWVTGIVIVPGPHCRDKEGFDLLSRVVEVEVDKVGRESWKHMANLVVPIDARTRT